MMLLLRTAQLGLVVTISTTAFTHSGLPAWIVPPAVLVLGILAILVVVHRWRSQRIEALASSETAAFLYVRHEIRKETEL